MDHPVAEIIERELPNIHGWCTIEKGKRMAEIARGAHLCVELGVFGGRGLISMALSLKEQGFGRADGIDPYTAKAALEGTNDPQNDAWWAALDYAAIADAAQGAIDDLELQEHARLLKMTSSQASTYYPDGSIDVLHQDSNHSEEVSCAEVELWAPKMRAGGFWIFDDANWSTTQRAQRELVAKGFVMIENHDAWAVYQKPASSAS